MNPTLVKQLARRVCAVGLPLWRHMVAAGTAKAAVGSSSSTVSRVHLTPAQIKQALADFAARNESYKAFLELPKNRNLPRQLGTLLQLLAVNDDPLIIEADIVTARWVCAARHGMSGAAPCRHLFRYLPAKHTHTSPKPCASPEPWLDLIGTFACRLLGTVRLQGQRATSLNNVLSEARSAFRLLFGRCLFPLCLPLEVWLLVSLGSCLGAAKAAYTQEAGADHPPCPPAGSHTKGKCACGTEHA